MDVILGFYNHECTRRFYSSLVVYWFFFRNSWSGIRMCKFWPSFFYLFLQNLTTMIVTQSHITSMTMMRMKMTKMMTNSPPKIIPRNKTNEIITVAPIATIKDLPIIKITIKNPTRSLKKAPACGVTVVSLKKRFHLYPQSSSLFLRKYWQYQC